MIPGSHLASEPPIDINPRVRHRHWPLPGEVKIIGPRRVSDLVQQPDQWHSGTFNDTPAARLALTATFAPGPPWKLED